MTGPEWHGGLPAGEPPPYIRHVRDCDGYTADRTGRPCEYCGNSGSIWRWRHNGNAGCWLDIDGVGPWVGWSTDPEETR